MPLTLVNFALLGWFYGRARATTGMLLQFLLHGSNIAFSITFVYAFGWGLTGVATGTVLAEAISAVAGLALVLRHSGGLTALRAAVPNIRSARRAGPDASDRAQPGSCHPVHRS